MFKKILLIILVVFSLLLSNINVYAMSSETEEQWEKSWDDIKTLICNFSSIAGEPYSVTSLVDGLCAVEKPLEFVETGKNPYDMRDLIEKIAEEEGMNSAPVKVFEIIEISANAYWNFAKQLGNLFRTQEEYAENVRILYSDFFEMHLEGLSTIIAQAQNSVELPKTTLDNMQRTLSDTRTAETIKEDINDNWILFILNPGVKKELLSMADLMIEAANTVDVHQLYDAYYVPKLENETVISEEVIDSPSNNEVIEEPVITPQDTSKPSNGESNDNQQPTISGDDGGIDNTYVEPTPSPEVKKYVYYCYEANNEYSPLEYAEGKHFSNYHEMILNEPISKIQGYSSIDGSPYYYVGNGKAWYFKGETTESSASYEYVYYCYQNNDEYSPLEYAENKHFSEYHEMVLSSPITKIQGYSSIDGSPYYYVGNGKAWYFKEQRPIN